MKDGVSEIIGEAAFGDGTKAAAYRALRPLLCSSCGGMMAEGTLFTRERRAAGQGLRLWPRCPECAPFALVPATAKRSPLLAALLAPTEQERAMIATPGEHQQEEGPSEARRKAQAAMRSRLGPALERARRSRR
jgi:hypothetical protein